MRVAGPGPGLLGSRGEPPDKKSEDRRHVRKPAPQVLLTLPAIPSKVVSFQFPSMPIKKIQVGQVWKKEDSGDSYLVTKVYTEALATFAVLRKAGSETDAPLRIKIGHAGASPTLPGFRFTQESEEF